MKPCIIRLLGFALLTLVAMMEFPVVAVAESTVGVYFDTEAVSVFESPPMFTTTNEFYIVANDLVNDELKGMEIGILIDPTILTFGSPPIIPPGGWLSSSDNPSEIVVGLWMGCSPAGNPAPLVQYTYGIFSQGVSDLTICLRGVTPSSFPSGLPGYLTCDSELEPFTLAPPPSDDYPSACAVVYPTITVPTSVESWGSVKGRF